jgi:hypothetical protein
MRPLEVLIELMERSDRIPRSLSEGCVRFACV